MPVSWPHPDEPFFGRAPVRRPVGRDVDQTVAGGIVARLLGHDSTGDQRIEVQVQNRVAILTGAVDSLDVVILAGDLAWQAPGVIDVCNSLTVALAGVEKQSPGTDGADQ